MWWWSLLNFHKKHSSLYTSWNFSSAHYRFVTRMLKIKFLLLNICNLTVHHYFKKVTQNGAWMSLNKMSGIVMANKLQMGLFWAYPRTQPAAVRLNVLTERSRFYFPLWAPRPVKTVICKQQICRSAWTSMQSDQRLCFRWLDSIISKLAISKILRVASFCSWAGRFESHLVAYLQRQVFSWSSS